MSMACIQYLNPMKPKKQSLYPLRFETKAQRELIRKAAKLEHRSMNNYILRAILEKAGQTLSQSCLEAVEQATA